MAKQESSRAVLFAAIASVVAWGIPGAGLILLPIQYLNTHLHELCHALAAWATSGTPQYILVFSNGSGVTPVAGGWLPIVASAGYLGTTLLGSAIVAATRDAKGAQIVLKTLAIGLALSVLLLVRGDFVGFASGVLWVGLLGFAGWRGSGRALLYGVQFLGVQLALTSIQSVYLLYRISVFGERQSDAGIMEQVSGIPTAVWAFSWCAISLAMVFLGVRRALKPPANRAV